MPCFVRRLRGGVFPFACAAALLSGPVFGAGLQVTPISLEIAAPEQAQSIILSNNGKAPMRAQVRVQQWSQSEGEDKLESTREVVASPPLVEIAPGERQMVRIVRLQPAPVALERTYRLIIDELPPTEAAAPAQAGLQFLMRYSVPVFVSPAGAPVAPVDAAAAPSDLSRLLANLKPDGQGMLLSVVNQGPRRLKLSQLVLVDTNGQRTVVHPGLLGYALAGRSMQWQLKLTPQQLQGGLLKAKFNDDQEEQTLPLADRR
jgi:fimbrial chaperone protein